MYKLGVVGVGNMGKNHVRVIHRLYEEGYPVKLKAIMDVKEEYVKIYSKKYGCVGYTDFDKFSSLDLDGVVIATPTHIHDSTSIPLIENGVDLLIEKPLAHNSEAANRILEKAIENGVEILVGHIERFNPSVRKLKELLEVGYGGNIISMSARRVGPGMNYRVKKIGVTLDLAIHDIDIFHFLSGKEISEMEIYSGSMTPPYEYEDYSFVTVKLGDIIGSVETNWLTPYKLRKLYVTGDRGVFELDYIEQRLIYAGNGGDTPIEIDVDKEEPLYLEHIHFLNILMRRERPEVDVNYAYNLIKKIEESRKTHIILKI